MVSTLTAIELKTLAPLEALSVYINAFSFEGGVQSLRISLTDQVSLKRIRRPCRGARCRHLQCFDESVYLDLNKSRDHVDYICPICNQRSIPSHTYIDHIAEGLLHIYSCANQSTITVTSDGRAESIEFPRIGCYMDDMVNLNTNAANANGSTYTSFADMNKPALEEVEGILNKSSSAELKSYHELAAIDLMHVFEARPWRFQCWKALEQSLRNIPNLGPIKAKLLIKSLLSKAVKDPIELPRKITFAELADQAIASSSKSIRAEAATEKQKDALTTKYQSRNAEAAANSNGTIVPAGRKVFRPTKPGKRSRLAEPSVNLEFIDREGKVIKSIETQQECNELTDHGLADGHNDDDDDDDDGDYEDDVIIVQDSSTKEVMDVVESEHEPTVAKRDVTESSPTSPSSSVAETPTVDSKVPTSERQIHAKPAVHVATESLKPSITACKVPIKSSKPPAPLVLPPRESPPSLPIASHFQRPSAYAGSSSMTSQWDCSSSGARYQHRSNQLKRPYHETNMRYSYTNYGFPEHEGRYMEQEGRYRPYHEQNRPQGSMHSQFEGQWHEAQKRASSWNGEAIYRSESNRYNGYGGGKQIRFNDVNSTGNWSRDTARRERREIDRRTHDGWTDRRW